ncbi:MAG: hypothetical protein FWG98_06960 [Candidatus Cloacimonetes bacterium]|nr:hypothetical protein [Candidatus Cloacimonadota bacterium]
MDNREWTMDNDKYKYHRNTSKMLSFNRNLIHHHENTLKGLSLFRDPPFQDIYKK